MHRSTAFLLSFLFVLVLFSQVTLFTISDSEPKLEDVKIARVIDGDTFELDDGRTIRLLNINSPEKNSPLSSMATSFLKSYENSTVQLQAVSEDKYQRTLARVYAPDYLNAELVRRGLASKFLVSEDEIKAFSSLEKDAIDNGLGIWSHSDYYGCFMIKVDEQDEVVVIRNICGVDLEGFTLKDESRKIYKFGDSEENEIVLHTSNGQDTKKEFFWNSQTNIWNNDRDSAYLFDKENKIAGYYSYGY